MAITPTGAIYKTLTFDGESSADYGVYITGQAVFNAPEREVEMITIPGRNGTFALDKGRFENVTVTYPAGIFADTDEDFSEAISDFRNLLCSRQGYVRLEDDYNPNEYRLAVYKSGLEVELAQLKAGEFNIVFECKPQRFLTSGETAIEVDSGDDIENPTELEAKPLLEVEAPSGGTISFNGKISISLTSSPMGRVVLANAANKVAGVYYATFDEDLLNTGDPIFIEQASMSFSFHSTKKISTASKTSESGGAESSSTLSNDGFNIFGEIIFKNLSFTYGTASQYSRSFNIAVTASDSSTGTEEVECTISYDGINAIMMAPNITADAVFVYMGGPAQFKSSNIEAESSIFPLSQTAYIDCELGEGYVIFNDKAYPINQNISFGADLPKLIAGTNRVNFMGPQSLKIVPRWWKI